MKKQVLTVFFGMCFFLLSHAAHAQCSVCTRTAEQLGEKPAKSLNLGILYLAATPLAMAGIVGYRWWKKNGTQ